MLALTTLLLFSVGACTSTSADRPSSGAASTVSPQAGASDGGDGAETFIPFDVRPLLRPRHKYLGAALEGAPESTAVVRSFAAAIGKRPNLLEYYAGWGDQYDVRGVRTAWAEGALPLMAWEPFSPSLRAIADGATDGYIRKFAADVRALNIPVAISFGHEMNGHWYPWGTKTNSATDFVRTWRHIHDVFLDVGAANVIWIWSPNVINPVPGVALRPYYPGDAYVDWVGLVGYYTRTGAHTFPTLWAPTMSAVRAFARKPFLLAETGAQPGPRKSADVADLFTGVAASPDILGFVWFEYVKRADWRITTAPVALAEYRRRVADPRFGFDVMRP